MTTIASPYSPTRTPAWKLARYQRAVNKLRQLIAAESDEHSTRLQVSVARMEARHATEEAVAVLNREGHR